MGRGRSVISVEAFWPKYFGCERPPIHGMASAQHAYRELARVTHPDKGGDGTSFIALTALYNCAQAHEKTAQKAQEECAKLRREVAAANETLETRVAVEVYNCRTQCAEWYHTQLCREVTAVNKQRDAEIEGVRQKLNKVTKELTASRKRAATLTDELAKKRVPKQEPNAEPNATPCQEIAKQRMQLEKDGKMQRDLAKQWRKGRDVYCIEHSPPMPCAMRYAAITSKNNPRNSPHVRTT